jgi:flagellar biogenesis protein FliO
VIFSYLLTLFWVCGLAVGVLVVLRAAKGGGMAIGHAQPIRVVGRQAVGPGSNLMLVEVDGARMLLAVSRSGVTLIESKPTKSSNVIPIDSRFSVIIKRAGTRW